MDTKQQKQDILNTPILCYQTTNMILNNNKKKVDTVAEYCIVTLTWGDIFTAMHDHSRN